MSAATGTSEPDGRRRFSADQLERLTSHALEGPGMQENHGRSTADILVDSSLSRIDPHGVERLIVLLLLLEGKSLEPAATVARSRSAGPVATVAAGFGLGFFPSAIVADVAVVRVRQYGIGVFAVRSSGHCGARRFCVPRIAGAGLVRFARLRDSPSVAVVECFDEVAGHFAPEAREVVCA